MLNKTFTPLAKLASQSRSSDGAARLNCVSQFIGLYIQCSEHQITDIHPRGQRLGSANLARGSVVTDAGQSKSPIKTWVVTLLRILARFLFPESNTVQVKVT
jgi:hypothetical protein